MNGFLERKKKIELCLGLKRNLFNKQSFKS